MKTLYATRDPLAAGRITRQRVTEVMQTPVATVHVATPLPIALATMVRLGVRHLAAVESDGRCAGVLGDRAAVTAWAAGAAPLHLQTVKSVLHPHPAVIGSNAVVGQLAKLMRDTGTKAIAVIDQQGLPVGTVTVKDLVALLSRDPDDMQER